MGAGEGRWIMNSRNAGEEAAKIDAKEYVDAESTGPNPWREEAFEAYRAEVRRTGDDLDQDEFVRGYCDMMHTLLD